MMYRSSQCFEVLLEETRTAQMSSLRAGFPLRIPWAAGGSETEPKFVADVPQEGLARQLRLCGFDAKVAPNLGKSERHLVYRYNSRAEASTMPSLQELQCSFFLNKALWIS